MLKTFYQSFGFLGSIILAMFIFLCFIFWLAGISGITQMEPSKKKKVKLFFSFVFPPYPIVWVFVDMIRQRNAMRETEL